MKKMTTMITENGKEKRISVWLDERTAEALEQANDASLTKQYIIAEHRSKLDEYRETRRHCSLDASLENGFELADEHDYESDVFNGIEKERLKVAFAVLTNEQRELIRLVYFAGVPQKEIATQQGVDPTAIRNRLNKIYKKLKNYLE